MDTQNLEFLLINLHYYDFILPLSFYNSDTEDVTFCDYRVCLILSFIYLTILTSKCGEKNHFFDTDGVVPRELV